MPAELPRQLALFEMRPPLKLTHDWRWHVLGPAECGSCLALWPPGASHEQVIAFLTETCPVRRPGSGSVPFVYVCLA